MNEYTKAIMIAVWWGYGNKWFASKDVAEVLKLNPGGVGSALRALYNQGLLDRKRRSLEEDKYQRKGFLYKLNKKGTDKVLWLIRVTTNDD